ncbi:MAG: spermidine synthase, partial [Thermoanaerobaculia bacterium]
NGNLLQQPRLEVRVADARRYVRATVESYDVIVADLFHPARDGAGALYTVEHFRAVRQRLAVDGLFCQWLPLHQLDLPTLGTIVRSFLAVFPDSHAFLAYLNVEAPALGLVGTSGPIGWTPDWYEQRVRSSGLSMVMAENGLGSSLALFGTFVGDGDWLAELSATSALNTDNHPRVIFLAPSAAYTRGRDPSELLHQLLRRWSPKAAQLLASDGTGQGLKLAARLDHYFVARDLYLQAEIERVGGDLEEAVESYLASVRASADFRTGYAQLLLLAQERMVAMPAAAIEILQALELAAPERPEASQLLRRLTGTPADLPAELPASD